MKREYGPSGFSLIIAHDALDSQFPSRHQFAGLIKEVKNQDSLLPLHGTLREERKFLNLVH
jgi:hypothetical protein